MTDEEINMGEVAWKLKEMMQDIYVALDKEENEYTNILKSLLSGLNNLAYLLRFRK